MAYKYFTEEEDEIIRNNSLEKAAQLLPNREKESIAARAKRLGVEVNRATKWSLEEDEILRQEYPSGGEEAVRKQLPEKTTPSVIKRAKQLGLINDGWTRDEDYLIFKSNFIYTKELKAKLPGRSPSEISGRCRILAEKRNNKISYPLNLYIALYGTHRGYDKCYASFENSVRRVKDTVLERKTSPQHIAFRAFSMFYEEAMERDFISRELGVNPEKVEGLIAGVLSGYKKILRRKL